MSNKQNKPNWRSTLEVVAIAIGGGLAVIAGAETLPVWGSFAIGAAAAGIPVAVIRLFFQSSFQRGRILLVDDDPQFLQEFGDFLDSMNEQCIRTQYASKALDKLDEDKKESIKLALLDHVLKDPETGNYQDLQGTDLARTINKRRPDIFIIIVSGYPLEQATLEALERANTPEEAIAILPQEQNRFREEMLQVEGVRDVIYKLQVKSNMKLIYNKYIDKDRTNY